MKLFARVVFINVDEHVLKYIYYRNLHNGYHIVIV